MRVFSAPLVCRIQWIGRNSLGTKPPQDMNVPAPQGTNNDETTIVAYVVSFTLGSILLLLTLYRLRTAWLTWRNNKLNQRAEIDHKLSQAIRTTSEFKFASVLISCRDFESLGTLKPHEELRDRGMLHYHDTLSELEAAPQRVVFFSHQWTAWDQPDPTGQQYAVMLAALRHLQADRGWLATEIWIWVDYLSIPQRTHHMQGLAIESLSAYASVANAFVIIAPNVLHADTGHVCGVHSYNQRMWCRAENLCHSMRNGFSRMYVATDETTCRLVKEVRSVLSSSYL